MFASYAMAPLNIRQMLPPILIGMAWAGTAVFLSERVFAIGGAPSRTRYFVAVIARSKRQT